MTTMCRENPAREELDLVNQMAVWEAENGKIETIPNKFTKIKHGFTASFESNVARREARKAQEARERAFKKRGSTK